MDQQQRSEVLKAYEAYLKAFIASDMASINSLVQYPFTHIGDGSENTFDHFPIKPSEMRKTKGFWDKQGLSVFTETLAGPLRLQTIYRIKTESWVCEWCSEPARGPFQKVKGGLQLHHQHERLFWF